MLHPLADMRRAALETRSQGKDDIMFSSTHAVVHDRVLPVFRYPNSNILDPKLEGRLYTENSAIQGGGRRTPPIYNRPDLRVELFTKSRTDTNRLNESLKKAMIDRWASSRRRRVLELRSLSPPLVAHLRIGCIVL
ncbi:hypothetical protein EW146_g8745 [Bondarzewia mesenterica]|uniref:Uncharacterized protein n=1 Tax=Bondarzewia mesenterica TaxID=1095465 RepID=A0A4S4LDQ9_9AGAM|nr:hypothetical protein EW146_g8745 [Bondarzewia mesenterica]